jgi:hypothetical protein
MAAITGWQSVTFLDSLEGYEQDLTAFDAYGAPLTTALVKTINATHCNLHQTNNYDKPIGGDVRIKANNIDTADKVDFLHTVAVRAGMTLKITDRNGSVGWYTVMGAPKQRRVLGFAFVFLNAIPTPAGM